MPVGEIIQKTDFIDCFGFYTSGGTWTKTVTAGLKTMVRTAAVGVTVVGLTIAPGQLTRQFGRELVQINIPTNIGVHSLTNSIISHLYAQNLYKAVSGGGTAITVTSIPITASASRSVLTDNLWTFAVTSPAFDSLNFTVNPLNYYLQLSIACATATTLNFKDAYLTYNAVG